ncbi:MAG: tetratricopeptide repeat protein [Asgard group archaeon]|nr:tetratricopeptide repeat protein [Asgard group archaeon]
MSSDIEKQLKEVEQLVYHGNYQEALVIIKKALKKNTLSKEEELHLLVYKCESKMYLGNIKESLKIVNQVLGERNTLDYPLIQINALVLKSQGTYLSGKIEEGKKIAEEALDFISKKEDLPKKIIAARKAYLLAVIGSATHVLGNLEKANENYEKALLLAEESEDKWMMSFILASLGIFHFIYGRREKAEECLEKALEYSEELGNKFLIALCYLYKGLNERQKREFQKAIEFFEKSFAITEEYGSTVLLAYKNQLGDTYEAMFQLDKAMECYQESLKHEVMLKYMSYANIGYVYYLKSEFEEAQEYFMTSLEICEKMKNRFFIQLVLYYLILISLELNNTKKAQQHLKRLEELSGETDNRDIKRMHRFATIVTLKVSGDVGDLGKAVELLNTILKEHDLPSKWRLEALYSLMEIRLIELQISPNEEALKEVQKRLYHLEVETEEQKQHFLLANVYRLQSQLALVELNAKKAIELLEKAQTIAEEFDLELLRKKIKEDRDKIDNQLDMWNELQVQKAPINESIKHVSLESTTKNIKKDTILEERDEETGNIIEYRKLFALKI